MLVGEQPGDQEDLAGEPFVGAAGRVLREALAAAGLDPAEIYLTNAVKHFKWTPRGKRRIHERPNHPSSILRAPDWESRTLAMRQFIDDLKLVAGALNARRR
jgi:uracil-DNA glycosylase